VAGHAGEFFIVMNEHTTRNFRPKVDFISAMGFGRTGRERAALGLPGRGPRLLISPFGVFDFTEDEHRLRVRTVHPWSSLEEIRANTGFELAEGADVQPTTAPGPDELEILRTVVDRTGVLMRKSGAS